METPYKFICKLNEIEPKIRELTNNSILILSTAH